MSRRRSAATALVIIFIISIACSFSGAGSPTKPTPNAQATQTQAILDRLATSEYWATVDTKDQAQAIQNANATITAAAQSNYSTATVRARGTATAQFLASSTIQASTMQRRVQDLIMKGVLNSNQSQGTFASLPNFDQSLASQNSGKVFPSELAPNNFVLRANTFWDAASTGTNWFASGCGFVFHMSNNSQDYYAIRLTLDGHADLLSYKNGVMSDVYKTFYGYVSTPSGGAQVMLVVNNGWIYFYVNEKQVLKFQANEHPIGQIGTAVYSGTNQGFGVRCQMTNIEVWQLQ